MNKLWILLLAVLAVNVAADSATGYQDDDYQDDDVFVDPDLYDHINEKDSFIEDEPPLPQPGQVDSFNKDEILQDDHVNENEDDLFPLPLPEPLSDQNEESNDDYPDKEVLDEINEFRKNIEDYQFEDNRFKQNNDEFEGNDEFEEAIPAANNQDVVVDDNDQIFDETRDILNEDDSAEDQFETNDENVDSKVPETNDDDDEEVPFVGSEQLDTLDENDQNVPDETMPIQNEDDNDKMDDQFYDDQNKYMDAPEDEEIKPELSFQELDDILNNIDQDSNSPDNFNIDLNEENVQEPETLDEEGVINNPDNNEDENEQIEDAMPFNNEQADNKQVDDVGNFFNFLETNDDTANDQSNDESEQIDDTNHDVGINDYDGNDEWKENEDQNLDPVSHDSDNNDNFDDYDTDKILEDIGDDLDSLFATWDKLTKSDSEEDEVQKYESENLRPYGEESILSQRQDEDLAPVNSQEDCLNENDSESDEIDEENQENDENVQQNEDWQRSLEDDEKDNIESPVIYSDDGIMDDQITSDEQKETEESQRITIRVEDLTSTQYDDLMKQFAIAYHDDLDTQAKGLGREVAPIHMKLSVDEPTIVTSPNYPNAYPTNNIVDWIFDGEGTGIEFNITDLALNGALGDYLLVKPGGEDETGTDGLLFSYTLAEPRNYRFFDVDKMFVRFEAKLGLAFSRGFQFSVKMIDPLPEDAEPEPDAEPLLPNPTSTMTVSLGGINDQEFRNIQEDFRQLIADMAIMYINANHIESGVNTTSEITQITRVALCNINWPGYENCVLVTFGVPLVYTDDIPARLDIEDLHKMWNTYVSVDPFAQRLERMGIQEFVVPDDRRVIMIWLVIGIGVLISAAMLAMALWRFSCFEDYTRMPLFSDTDSINEKKGLDLYPTPHQNLPPLYGDPEKEFKWEENFGDSARVDMGGYANRNFTRDELFDIESDEDNMMTTRDRTSITPRDIYKV